MATAVEPAAPADVAAPPLTVGAATAPAVSTSAAPAAPTVTPANPAAHAGAIEAMVKLAHQHGRSTARIALAPEALGGIQVTLLFGNEGVTARLIAERPEAAAALTRAGQDLRDSLQAQGIDLASLETGFAGDSGRRDSSNRPGDSSLFTPRPAARRDADASTTTLHLTLQDQPITAPLHPGRLIDLRA